jgi:hypothetical protein
MYPLVTIAELKTYLGITGAQDDALLASVASNASIIAAAETGRTFAVESNVTRRYSTDGQASLIVHDMPYSDGSRVVTMDGTALVADSGYWLLPDRRNPDVSTTIQLRHFEVGWNRRSYNWFDGNLDRRPYFSGTPNDLVITGVVGHPTLPLDVFEAVRALAALLFWRAKAGASGIITTPLGDEIDVSVDRPRGWPEFVAKWRIRTAVAPV